MPSTQSLCLIDELLDQLDNLRASVHAYDAGVYTMYKQISVTLRTVLRGSSGASALASQVLTNPLLHPLLTSPDPAKHDHIQIPGRMTITGCGTFVQAPGGYGKNIFVDGSAVKSTSIESPFDTVATPIPLFNWLKQPFLKATWTLESFLTCVAHKDGGAHIEHTDQLQALRAMGHFHWPLTAAITRYVEQRVRHLLQVQHPTHVRAVR